MNRILVRTTTAVAAVSAAALFFPAVATAAPVSKTECAEISTGTEANGWGNTFTDESGQAGRHSETNIVDQDGSLELTVAEGKNRAVSYHEAGALKLADLAGPLTFDHDGAVANWQIRVTGAATGAGDGFATLVWSGEGEDAATSDQWWATRALGDLERGEKTTLTDLKTRTGAATVINHYGISVEGTPGTKANIDNVAFNGCTTNFKATGSAEEDSGSFGSVGDLGLGDLIGGLLP